MSGTYQTLVALLDLAAQMFGGRGVRRGEIIESLYREVRELRIYEGLQKFARELAAQA